ncbi:MAG: hypothetical protein IKP12_05355 [Acholeplasmatales bacterium]|nr:hypothetical protein [Acholeplasmatales bacterium]
MDIKEAKELIKKLKKETITDLEIVNTFAYRYVNDEYDLNTLNLLINELGYSLDNDFLKANKKKQLKLIMKNKVIDTAQDSYLIDGIETEDF